MDENKNVNEEVFTTYTGMNYMEMEKLIDEKILLLNKKLNGDITDNERSNEGFLLWNCKMILRNILMATDKITNKYKSDISDETYEKYTKLADIINNEQKTWTSMDAIRNTCEKIAKFSSLNTNDKELNNSNQDFNNKGLGWDYITEVFDNLYPNQEPKHYAPMIKAQFGGQDPLDGISIYDAGDYYHFVTYGFSEIYERENDSDISGYGFELTYKLKKTDAIDEQELKNFTEILQTLGRHVFGSGAVFKPYEYIYTGQTEGMDSKQKSLITGFVTIEDPQAKTIDTVNGKVQFVELIGATSDELKVILNKEKTKEEVINRILEQYGDITDYNRNSIMN